MLDHKPLAFCLWTGAWDSELVIREIFYGIEACVVIIEPIFLIPSSVLSGG